MQPSPARRPPQALDTVTAIAPPMSPDSSGELSPFDLLSDIGDVGPASPTDDGTQRDSPSAQKWDGHTEIAEQAKHEAEIENRIAELRKEGFWSPRRLSKFPEPTRPKVQWDYLCEEMQWLAADFAQERRWKRGVARKVVRMVVRHHEELKQKEERARREEQAKLRRIATSIAKEVRQFWSNVEKVVQFKQQSRLEAKRKKALDLQLDFIVGQTEKYSDLLSQSLNETIPASKTSSSCVGSSQGGSLRTSPAPSVCQKDGEFLPHEDEVEQEDDEETIEIEERQDGNDAESHRLELELLRRESELPLHELLQSLPPEILKEDPETEAADSDAQDSSSSSSSSSGEEEVVDDDEFTANEEEAEDEEETIEAEEAMEGQQDHAKELSELAQEGELSIEDLLKKYYLARSEAKAADQSESSHVSERVTSDSSECESSEDESEGVEFLVKEEDEDAGSSHLQIEPPEPKKEITDIAATAESLQPKGYTLATTQVKTSVPFLLRGELREYQHIGLEWLVTMYEKKLNGILADEMGLGKTIQTISLLAHLACERGNWGPHLIIVPTSVILNWEMELKRWCPSFKILTYYGSQKERKLKRQGWTKANAFHVCITSYKLVLQDHQAFRRKNWRYLILDEAQNIKNFKSQRWQSLLNFNSQRRLLLTGTPLQNSLMELWSLMHFLMPHVFQSHREFKEWFSNPLTGMIEGSQEYNEGLVRRLHKVLRPFLLRRIKQDVEKQMPKKYEHVIYCRLSKRQRFLYDDFMAQAATKESLASGHFMSVINILMQLRKVCNHPNLFDPRPIHSPFITSAICYSVPSPVLHALQRHPLEYVDLSWFDLVNMEGYISRYESDVFLPRYKPSRSLIQEICNSPEPPPRPRPLKMKVNRMLQPVVKPDPRSSVVVVNGSRPAQKAPDIPKPPSPPPPPPPPLPPAPPAPTASTPPVPAVPAPAVPVPPPVAPPPVQAPPAPVSVSPVPSDPGKPVPVPNSQPVYSAPQRFILTPDMQARLPSGEVISLSQLASLSGRPLPGPAVTKPLTLQLQGAKLTLGSPPVRPVGVSQPRPMQGNVLHLVSSGGQHHLLSQPAQLALIQALAQQATSPAPAAAAQLVQNNTSQMGVQTVSLQGLQHPLVNNANLPAAAGPAMNSPGQVSAPGVVKIVVRQAPRDVQGPPQRPSLAAQVRPVLRVLPAPHIESGIPRDGSLERAAPVVATSAITLASSPLLMVSNPAVATRLPSPNPEDSPAPPMSGVALRLVAAGTSSAVQLTNHRSSPPNHTGSGAIQNCAPCPAHNSVTANCTTSQQFMTADSAPSPLLLKAAHTADSVLPDCHSVQNGSSGPQNTSSDSVLSAPATTCVPSTTNSANPTLNTPKVSPPTYNLSLVPALLTNSASSTAARFLTSPLSLLALSPLASANSNPTSVLYTPPNATAFPTLAAPPLSSASVSTSLPILATPGQLASFAAPANHSTLPASLTMQHPAMEAPPAVPVVNPLSAPTGTPLPVLSTPAPATLLAATATTNLLEASGNSPLLLAPDSGQMLDPSAADTVPPLVLNSSLKLPPVAPVQMPILPASNAIPLLAAASGKVPVPLLNMTATSPNLPLLSTSITTAGSPFSMATAVLTTSSLSSQAASIPISSVRAMTPLASVMSTASPSLTSVTSSSLPQLSTSGPLPTLLPKPSAPSVQVKAAALLPPGLVDVPSPMCTAVPVEAPTSLCPLPAEVPTPLLPSAALEPAMVPLLAASVAGSCLSQSVIPAVQVRPPAPQPSLPASTMTPSMPASAPAPLPSLPASTPIPIPLLPASTPAPVSSLPASSPDPSSLLPVSTPAPAPDLSSSGDPAAVPLLPPSATNPLVSSVSAPLTLPAPTSLALSTSSHVSLPSSQSSAPLSAAEVQPSGVTAVKSASPSPTPISHSSSSVSSSSNSLDNTSTIPPSASNQDTKNFQEPSLSLSVAGPQPVSVTLGSTPDSEATLEGDETRFTHSSTFSTTVRPRRLLPPPPRSPFYLEPLEERRRKQKMERLDRIFQLNERRCNLSPIYGTEVISVCTLQQSYVRAQCSIFQTDVFRGCIFTSEQRLEQLRPIIERFIIAMPPVEAPQITLHTSHPPPSLLLQESLFRETLSRELTPHTRCLHRIISNMRTQFPDLRLIQYDCGKLQTLDRLLRELKSGGHRVLLFTQMTRMLDVLEQFLNYHGHIYLRLDGSTRVEQRQALMERFNMDKRIFCFILSTRSGGVGVNLTGADTVIFYDSDWNPTMDAQAQDRCHRIGQTRDVHIYRLVSERTVEENILKKAQQKRMLGDMAIEGGNFTTAYFKQQTIRELFDMEDFSRKEMEMQTPPPDTSAEEAASSRQTNILEQALGKAEDEEDTLAASLVRAEQVADLAEFSENAPLEPEEEEQSRVEQEISALVEQLTPIERYAMYFLEASLEEISREELKQAEEQVEAARKDLILAKDDGGQSIEEKWEEEIRRNRKVRTPTPARVPGERVGVRMSERLRGNKATDSTDVTESTVIVDLPLSPPKVQQEVHETAESALDDEDNHLVPQTSDNAAVTSETLINLETSIKLETPLIPESPITPEPTTPTIEVPVTLQESSVVVESVQQEDVTEGIEAESVPSIKPAEDRPVSPGPQEAPAAPRTPRRKVTADCEISLAGASEGSPTAKVLRRLPGRLVTVVEEKLPTHRRRQNRGKSVTDNGALSPNPSECQSPPYERLSEESSEVESPPRKKRRGRPPRASIDLSPSSAPCDQSPEPTSPPPAVPSELVPSPVAFLTPPSPTSPFKLVPSPMPSWTPSSPSSSSKLAPSSAAFLTPASPNSSKLESSSMVSRTPASPISPSKLNYESDSSSAEKRKRGRPPKRREGSPGSSPVSQSVASPPSPVVSVLGAPLSPTGSSVGAFPSSPFCASPKSPVVASPMSTVCVLGGGTLQLDTREADRSPVQVKAKDKEPNAAVSSAVSSPSAIPIVPIPSSNIPVVGSEGGTSSSGTDEPLTPSRRKRGRPPRSQTVLKINFSPPLLHNNKLDSSPDRTPSPHITRGPPRKGKPLKARDKVPKEQNSSLAESDDSSEEEVTVRTPLTRSARTRLQVDRPLPAVSKKTEVIPKPRRGRSPRTTPTPDKPSIKKRKPASPSSPSPPSSSPHGSSGGKQKGSRKKRHCSPAERVLRSSLTANPASNTRSSRPQLLYFPSSNRGRKAKT